jgi:hypothetical protein
VIKKGGPYLGNRALQIPESIRAISTALGRGGGKEPANLVIVLATRLLACPPLKRCAAVCGGRYSVINWPTMASDVGQALINLPPHTGVFPTRLHAKRILPEIRGVKLGHPVDQLAPYCVDNHT